MPSLVDNKDATHLSQSLNNLRCSSAPVFDTWSDEMDFSGFPGGTYSTHRSTTTVEPPAADDNTSPNRSSSSSADTECDTRRERMHFQMQQHHNERAFSRLAMQSSSTHSVGEMSLCSSDNDTAFSSDGSHQNFASEFVTTERARNQPRVNETGSARPVSFISQSHEFGATESMARTRTRVRNQFQVGSARPVSMTSQFHELNFYKERDAIFADPRSSEDFLLEIGRPVSVPPEMYREVSPDHGDFPVEFQRDDTSFPCSRSMHALLNGMYESKAFTEDACRMLRSTSWEWFWALVLRGFPVHSILRSVFSHTPWTSKRSFPVKATLRTKSYDMLSSLQLQVYGRMWERFRSLKHFKHVFLETLLNAQTY